MIQTPYDSREFLGGQTFLTDCGGRLQILNDYSMPDAQIEMGVHFEGDPEEMESDVLYTKFRLPDKDGIVWEYESRFSVEVILDTMNNLADSTSSLKKFADAPQAVADAFSEKSCLKGVTYCNDDRMYRHVLVGDSAKEINFHYSALSFDFCFLEISFFTRLCVKISGLTEDDLLYTTSPFVGPNTAFYSEDENSWVSHTIPAPVLFKKTNETAKSNIGVVYSQNGE